MLDGTYGGLKASVLDWLVRPDLATVFPDFVKGCEARLRRTLKTTQVVTLDFTIDAATYTLPTDVQDVTSLYLVGPQYYGPLQLVTPERKAYLDGIGGGSTSLGIPQYFTNIAGVLTFGPGTPNGSFPAQAIYDQNIVALDTADTASTNWVLTNHPDVYLYGCLTEASPYIKDDERLPLWDTRFQTALLELSVARDRAQYGANTPIGRPKRSL